METLGRLSFWESIYLVFTNPSLLYEKIAIQKGMLKSFFSYSAVCIFVFLVSLLGNVLFNIFVFPVTFFESHYFLLVQAAYFVFSLFFLFAYSGAVFAILKLLGGVANFSETFRIIAYCFIPAFIISLIPVIGFVGGLIFSLILLAFGLRLAHNVSTIRSAFAVAAPIALFLLILILGLIPVYFVFS